VSAELDQLTRHGRRLAAVTIVWNTAEGVIALTSGRVAGSVALIGFGADSLVEVFAGSVILWRLTKLRGEKHASDAAERRAAKLIAATFLLLAATVAVESLHKLVNGEPPETSVAGIVVAAAALIVMPLLARAKRNVGRAIGSGAVVGDAAQSNLCAWLAAVVLTGLLLNALYHWWWVDPVAALAIVYVAAREGIERWNAPALDDCC
jgi:divalent metal cation (Fe/Co/Zn/Cd) transporter